MSAFDEWLGAWDQWGAPPVDPAWPPGFAAPGTSSTDPWMQAAGAPTPPWPGAAASLWPGASASTSQPAWPGAALIRSLAGRFPLLILVRPKLHVALLHEVTPPAPIPTSNRFAVLDEREIVDMNGAEVQLPRDLLLDSFVKSSKLSKKRMAKSTRLVR